MLRGETTVLETCGSTNTEAADRSRYAHGDTVVAIRQTAGRGQRGHRWESVPGENLTFSIVLEPTFLAAGEQFLLSEAIALAVTDTLQEYGIGAAIKWTNDIYVNDRKICGMLLEHNLDGTRLARTVAGIGLNVNQERFPAWIANPCSIRTETGIRHDIMEVFAKLYGHLSMRYGMLEEGRADRISDDYNTLLYRRGKPSRFFLPEEGEVIGTICGAGPDGRLTVTIDGKERGFLFREIEFVI